MSMQIPVLGKAGENWVMGSPQEALCHVILRWENGKRFVVDMPMARTLSESGLGTPNQVTLIHLHLESQRQRGPAGFLTFL